MTTIAPSRSGGASLSPLDRRHCHFLGDWCPRCSPLAEQADSRVRLTTYAEPEAVEWSGGRRVTTSYRCACCGHQWSRADLYDAASAGFGADRPYRRGAA